MKNPYPETRGHTLQRDCWQEGYDAKEKEAQDLYEALVIITAQFKRVEKLYSKDKEIIHNAERAMARWEDK